MMPDLTDRDFIEWLRSNIGKCSQADLNRLHGIAGVKRFDYHRVEVLCDLASLRLALASIAAGGCAKLSAYPGQALACSHYSREKYEMWCAACKAVDALKARIEEMERNG